MPNQETGTRAMPTKRELETKRELQSTKRELESTKRELESTKRIKDTALEYGEFGAPGKYTVIAEGVKDPIPIKAIYVRVLPNGELNLITDKGRWFLFAPRTWRSATPEQPAPEECEYCGHAPKESKENEPTAKSSAAGGQS